MKFRSKAKKNFKKKITFDVDDPRSNLANEEDFKIHTIFHPMALSLILETCVEYLHTW